MVAQEMYGVNDYLRSVCDFLRGARLCGDRAGALRPQAARPDLPLSPSEDHDRAQQTYTTWDLEHALTDLDAAHAAIADTGKVAIIGFCWGGSLAWLAPAGGTTPAPSPITAR